MATISLTYNPRNVLAKKTIDYVLSSGLFKQVPSPAETAGRCKAPSCATISQPKAEMTEQEFRAKLAHSSAQGAAGQYVEKRSDETMDQFLDRLLCM